jgi:hypothetical protein
MPAMGMTLSRFVGFGIAARIPIRRRLVLGLLVAILLAHPVQAGPFAADLLVTNQPGVVFLRWKQGTSLELSNVKTDRPKPNLTGFWKKDCEDFGDHPYRVIDAKTLEVLGGDGFSTYCRCPSSSAPQEPSRAYRPSPAASRPGPVRG